MTTRSLVAVAFACLAVALAGTSPASAQCGTRWVTKTGNTLPTNDCLSSATPCASINHAIAMACANDGIEVGEGSYFEDVVVDKRVFLNSTGVNANTILRGTGTSDIVRMVAGFATLNGFTINGPASGACFRIGDAAHPGVRGVQLTNSTLSRCRFGVVAESVGTTGEWIRINGNTVELSAADSVPDSGTGVLVVGGAGRFQVRQVTIRNNDGPGIKVGPGSNGRIDIAGNTITANGKGASAYGRAAIEVHQGADLHIEGNYVTGHTGLPSVDDGRAFLLDGVNVGRFYCNQATGNDGGLELAGSMSGFEALQNRFGGQTGPAVLVGPGSAAGAKLGENLFTGNGTGVLNQDVVTLNAIHNWWGAADGPSGAGGSGDSVVGPVDVSNLVARAIEPVLARAPEVAGWSRGAGAACHDTLQPAINAAPTNGLVLIGRGEILGRVTLNRRVDLEGSPVRIPYEWCDACYESVVNGTQPSGVPRLPAMTITGVSGVSVKYLTFHGAGMGAPACFGGHQDTEIGLDLQNVKDSTFAFLDFRENGTTDLRLYGDSDNNTISDVYVDGMIRDGDNEDRCGHRSREGILIDGGPRACESGAGAYADGNRILRSKTYHITRSIKLRYARNTEIGDSVIHGVPSDEWPEVNAVNLWVEASDDTNIHDNPEIGNRGVTQAIHVMGSRSCEAKDSARTIIARNTISMIENSGTGLHLVHAPGDNGAPIDTQVSCTTIEGALVGVLADFVDGTQITLTDIVSDTYGVRNDTTEPLTVSRSWWGSPSGPSGAGPGTGTSVSDYVLYPAFLSSSSRDDADHDGFSECDGDVDDTNPLLKPLDTCDGFDNDLDGTIDENFVATVTHCGVGPCAASGVTSCAGGAVQDSCAPLPPLATTDVTCDLVDDDCDGSLDEEYTGGPTSCGIGGCARTGQIGCVNGVVQDTCAPGTPSADDSVCNGVDDDCDGPVDEEFASVPTQCGLGVCAATGTLSCVAGVAGDSCSPGSPTAPTDGLCNGLDDDCDGASDEDYAPRQIWCGVGVCQRPATTACYGGIEDTSCTPYPPNAPTDGMCNGLDDDCDGPVDEDFEPMTTVCGVGSCARVGRFECVAGQLSENCTPGTPSAEACNGIDDDCDNFIDDVPPPPVLGGLAVTRGTDGVGLAWEDVGNAPVYDVVRGDVGLLLAAGGDFSGTLNDCVVDGVGATTYNDADPGPAAGASWWYLVRPQHCGGVGTYDDADPGLAAGRDASIAASPTACP